MPRTFERVGFSAAVFGYMTRITTVSDDGISGTAQEAHGIPDTT